MPEEPRDLQRCPTRENGVVSMDDDCAFMRGEPDRNPLHLDGRLFTYHAVRPTGRLRSAWWTQLCRRSRNAVGSGIVGLSFEFVGPVFCGSTTGCARTRCRSPGLSRPLRRRPSLIRALFRVGPRQAHRSQSADAHPTLLTEQPCWIEPKSRPACPGVGSGDPNPRRSAPCSSPAFSGSRRTLTKARSPLCCGAAMWSDNGLPGRQACSTRPP